MSQLKGMVIWKVVHLVQQAGISFFVFSLYRKIKPSCFPPVCKPEAVGWGIAIKAKVEQKGRMIFLFVKGLILVWAKHTVDILFSQICYHDKFSLYKNCATRLIIGRKSIRVTQSWLVYSSIWKYNFFKLIWSKKQFEN